MNHRVRFCEQVVESIQECVDQWTLITCRTTGARLVEHAWSRADQGLGQPPRTGVDLMPLEDFLSQVQSSPLRAKVSAAIVIADMAMHHGSPRPAGSQSDIPSDGPPGHGTADRAADRLSRTDPVLLSPY